MSSRRDGSSACFSCFLISSQFTMTSASSRTDTSPKTCGCLLIIFAVMPRITSSIVKRPSSSPICGYEVLEAIDEEDPDHLVEELGDVMLQVLLHAQIGEDDGLFTIDDVIRGITAKMIRRHPHVFGEVSVRITSSIVKRPSSSPICACSRTWSITSPSSSTRWSGSSSSIASSTS